MTTPTHSAIVAVILFLLLATLAALHAPAVLCVLFVVSLAVSLSDGRKFRPPNRK